MEIKRLGVVIVDGVGYRNFVLSDFLKVAQLNFEEIIIYSGLPATTINQHGFNTIKVVELPVFQENRMTWFFRKLKEIAHLQLHKNNFFGIKKNLEKNKPISKGVRATLTHVIFKITSIFNSESSINFFYKLQANSFKNNTVIKEYENILKSTTPQILFFTHQRPPYLAPLNEIAKKIGITTSSFIFSWDNLPSKGRMAAPFDKYLVWSNLMKEELHYFYPATKNQNVSIVGTPQFEPYVLERYKSTQAYFEETFCINNTLKTICYSCGDVSTSKNDGLYIETIAKAIKDQKIAPVNFIVRTSPAEDGSRFKELREKYPNIIWNFPQWKLTRENHPEPWSQRVPETVDLKNLRALLEYCDLNINMCSTMSLDFMLFDKPVINPVFGNKKNELYDDQKYLRYDHYKRVVKSNGVKIVVNEGELIDAINFSIKNPKARLTQQKELLELQIGKPLEGTSQRIVNILKQG